MLEALEIVITDLEGAVQLLSKDCNTKAVAVTIEHNINQSSLTLASCVSS